MALSFHPKAGTVLSCDFRGYVLPEMVKRRPVVVISPNHLGRPGLVTVVPLSRTPPDPVRAYHYKLLGSPFPHCDEESWAKCDMAATVSLERLDRFRIERGAYAAYAVSAEQVRRIRIGVARSIGLEIAAD